ncbi:MAG: PD-(D/E)XK nuclease family protein [Thaumarchaeota archaeon]|nr:PD-(D/E)XK nuclease family protein [Nitrososphaerota archaeon]
MSLDNYLHDKTESPMELTSAEKEKFEKWVSTILSDPMAIASTIEDALKSGMHTEWEAESANHKFRLGSYYPSMIEKCLRAQAYSYLSPQPPTPEELAIFAEGKAIHELIAFALRRSGLISVEGSEVAVDLEFSEEAKLHGRIDDLLLIRIEKAGDKFRLFVPLEIKSTSSLPDEPRASHYYQLSTYLLAQDYPLGVLLYWAKREGKVKCFTIVKDDVMRTVLRERVFELHEALKTGGLPQKEASTIRDYQQCERCAYIETCNPYLIDSITPGSKIALFDLESIILDTSEKKRVILQELGLPPSSRPSDIDDEQTKKKYWELLDSPKYIEYDVLIPLAKEKLYDQVKIGRVPIGISSSRRDSLLEATRARLANLGVPIFQLILREPGNYDSDGRFKTRWASRLGVNYDVVEIFDRDAVTSSLIMKGAQVKRSKQTSSGA